MLFGDVNPSGRLPVTFPVDEAQLEAVGIQMPFEQIDEVSPTTVYSDGIYVGYKAYLEQGATPLFPFGHGLSYTSFEYGDAVTAPAGGPGRHRPGRDHRDGHRDQHRRRTPARRSCRRTWGTSPPTSRQPDRALAGFTRVTLEPGRERRGRRSRSTAGRCSTGTSTRTRG